MTLGEMGINLLGETELEKQREEEDEFEVDDDAIVDEEAAEEESEDLLLETELVEGTVGRIDDPVRMYLTQMGEIPLLTRAQEISHARKIELTRMAFRRKVLESDYSALSAIEILQQVGVGTLPLEWPME